MDVAGIPINYCSKLKIDRVRTGSAAWVFFEIAAQLPGVLFREDPQHSEPVPRRKLRAYAALVLLVPTSGVTEVELLLPGKIGRYCVGEGKGRIQRRAMDRVNNNRLSRSRGNRCPRNARDMLIAG